MMSRRIKCCQKIEGIEFPKLEEISKGHLECAKLLDTAIVPENIRNSFIYNNKTCYKNFRNRKKNKEKVKSNSVVIRNKH